MTAEDQEERELEFLQHIYKHLVEYLEELWMFTEGIDAAYQKENLSLKSNPRLKSVHIIKMDEEKDDLKSIKVYMFNNTKENWHEFALKFRVIADSRGYDGIIDGAETPPMKKKKLRYLWMIKETY